MSDGNGVGSDALVIHYRFQLARYRFDTLSATLQHLGDLVVVVQGSMETELGSAEAVAALEERSAAQARTPVDRARSWVSGQLTLLRISYDGSLEIVLEAFPGVDALLALYGRWMAVDPGSADAGTAEGHQRRRQSAITLLTRYVGESQQPLFRRAIKTARHPVLMGATEALTKIDRLERGV